MSNNKTGIELIAAERQRQIEVEGYSITRDADLYNHEELAIAGALYALPDFNRLRLTKKHRVPLLWPWNDRYWKPTPDDRIKELIKSGALIAAAIDMELEKLKNVKP